MKRAAMAFTFDDGSRSQVELALPILEEFGFKATFFVIAGLTRQRKVDLPHPGRKRWWWAEVSWEEWRGIVARGHEVGNHSLTHALGGVARADDPLAEIVESRRIINDEIGRAPESFAFPFGKSNTHVRSLAQEYHQYVRGKRARYGGWWFSLKKANRLVDDAIRTGQPLIAMLHGVESGFQPVACEVLRAHCVYIKDREAEISVATFSEVCRRQEVLMKPLEAVRGGA